MLNDKPTLPGVTPLTNPKGKKKKVGRKARQKIFCSMVDKDEKKKKKLNNKRNLRSHEYKNQQIYTVMYILIW